MNNLEKLVEQHILQYISRLQHIDELMEQAEQDADKLDTDTKTRKEFDELKQQRDDFASYVDQLKTKSPEQLMQTAGPMVIWEFIAQRLEHLVEKIKT